MRSESTLARVAQFCRCEEESRRASVWERDGYSGLCRTEKTLRTHAMYRTDDEYYTRVHIQLRHARTILLEMVTSERYEETTASEWAIKLFFCFRIIIKRFDGSYWGFYSNAYLCLLFFGDMGIGGDWLPDCFDTTSAIEMNSAKSHLWLPRTINRVTTKRGTWVHEGNAVCELT